MAMVMVGSLVIYMWRTGPKVQERMRTRLNAVSSRRSRLAAVLGVFLFTFLMITREGMETALMLLQVHGSEMLTERCLAFALLQDSRGAGQNSGI